MAAYSRRRVESEVQYWTVEGGGGGRAGVVRVWFARGVVVVVGLFGVLVDGGEASVREGNWKN